MVIAPKARNIHLFGFFWMHLKDHLDFSEKYVYLVFFFFFFFFKYYVAKEDDDSAF